MLTVEHFELIRRKFLIDGMSQRAIASELRHSRKTVAKALAHAAPPGYQSSRPRVKRKISPFQAIIDAWLEEDKARPRKQRHTAQRVYERLRSEHGYTGSACTVRRYVAQRKPIRQEVYIPLEFKPGEEAQVDWGEAWVIENGIERQVQLFCMSFCHSGASFVYPYERANIESFLDGHVRAFEFFDGIPKRLAYDNLKSAVIQVGRGRERKLNERFLELRSWFLFESRFCNVARGNEKGHVENLVKRAQRTFLTPLPQVLNLAELAEQLRRDCLADLDRQADGAGGQTHRGLWEQERTCLLTLPASGAGTFPACQERSTTVDKYSLVQLDEHLYSVPVQWAHWPAVVKGFVDRVEIFCDHQCVARHARSYGRERFVVEPRHYLRLLERKPGCLDQGRPFQGQPWGEEFALLRRELEYRYGDKGTQQFITVLLLMEKHSEQRVRYAVAQCVARRAFSADAVLAVLHNEATPEVTRRLDLAHRPELQEVGDGIRPASLYDQLTAAAAEEVAA
jgi:transposase